MKNKIKLYSGLMAGVLLFSVLVYACTKEEVATEPQQPVEALTIENAQKWYNQHFGSAAKTKASSDAGDDDGITLIPQWNEAELSENSAWYTVESPLESSSDIRVLFMQEEVLNHAIDNKAYQQVKQVHRHVVMRNRETGETYAFIMVVMPTLEYMQRVGDALETNKYLSRESDLDGEVVYFNCAGEFVNGWIYEKGKITYGTHVEEFGGNRTKSFVLIEICHNQLALGGVAGDELGVIDDRMICRDYSLWTDDAPTLPEFGLGGGGDISLPALGSGGKWNAPEPKDKEPEERKDCAGKAAQNANNAQSAMEANEKTQKTVENLKEKASNQKVEYGTTIEYINGQYVIKDIVGGEQYSVTIPFNYQTTLYDIHTHPNAYGLTGKYLQDGPSERDIYSLLKDYIKSQAQGGVYKGSIIITSTGTEILICVNDPSLASNPSTRDKFATDSDGLFKDRALNDEYARITQDLISQGFSGSDASIFSMSRLLDKYNSGLKISKKEKGKNSFKETKTTEKSLNEYKPTICP
ncbi:hypothetical protein [Dysgonomonas sp. 25]|uniref:hypothetical protein n=1 Tax=Dysgonomonas sp. 25 TaxID=2302933 RepID=UPI0013D186EC|nr:hypothetical protein [Dysgonomonas sp. 25]